MNYTFTEISPDKCWYSLDGGLTNSTTQTCGLNWTSLISIEGANNWTVYINDSSSNLNSSVVYFYMTSDDPKWSNNLTNGSSSTINGDAVYFNITLTDDLGAGDYIFSFYNGTTWVNDSSASWTNNTEVEIIKGVTGTQSMNISWYWWFNDSFGNSNITDTWSFNIADSTVPNITLNSPVNLTNSTNSTINSK